MNFKDFNPEDLVKPSDFELTTQDVLFEEVLQTVNDELEQVRDSGEEIYESSDANVIVTLDEDAGGDEAISGDIIARIKQTYQEIGWKDVTYKFEEEEEDTYAVHTFTFFFNVTSTGHAFNL